MKFGSFRFRYLLSGFLCYFVFPQLLFILLLVVPSNIVQPGFNLPGRLRIS